MLGSGGSVLDLKRTQKQRSKQGKPGPRVSASRSAEDSSRDPHGSRSESSHALSEPRCDGLLVVVRSRQQQPARVLCPSFPAFATGKTPFRADNVRGVSAGVRRRPEAPATAVWRRRKVGRSGRKRERREPSCGTTIGEICGTHRRERGGWPGPAGQAATAVAACKLVEGAICFFRRSSWNTHSFLWQLWNSFGTTSHVQSCLRSHHTAGLPKMQRLE